MTQDHLSLAFGFAAIGFIFTFFSGTGGYLGPKGSMHLTWSPKALFLAALSIAFAVFFFGAVGGVAVIISVIWHEWGHVIAYRVAGHDDARFRLIPLFGGVAISDRAPRSELVSCYVSLMGPGFSISLVAALLLGAEWLAAQGSPWAFELYRAGVIAAAINAFNMLPLWPLDGGRALRSITVTSAPGLAPLMTNVMSAVLIGFAVIKQMWLLLLFALMGYSHARRSAQMEQRLPAMSNPEATLAVIAYLTILGAHVLAGLPLFRQIIGF